jgi:hypothetical protein
VKVTFEKPKTTTGPDVIEVGGETGKDEPESGGIGEPEREKQTKGRRDGGRILTDANRRWGERAKRMKKRIEAPNYGGIGA